MPTPSRTAEWDVRSEILKPLQHPLGPHRNDALHSFLLGITGRYLHCIADPHAETISFTYDIRKEADGFLKLDVLSEIMVGGVDIKSGPGLLPKS